MSHHSYVPENVCAQLISFDMENGKIHNISFMGGCSGNLKAIAKLVDGWSAEDIAAALEGNSCGRRPTSCADQLAKAVRDAVANAVELC